MITLEELRPLEFAIDKVDVGGSVVALDATTLAALETITVTATDLDIRDLAFATDKVDVGGSVIALDATTLAALETITVTATNLDIRDLAFATDKVDVSGSSVTTIPDAYDVWKVTAESVTSTAGQLVATSLAGRLSITIENLGNKDIYVGLTNAITTTVGSFKIAKGSAWSETLGAGAAVWAITDTGTADVRVLEFAA